MEGFESFQAFGLGPLPFVLVAAPVLEEADTLTPSEALDSPGYQLATQWPLSEFVVGLGTSSSKTWGNPGAEKRSCQCLALGTLGSGTQLPPFLQQILQCCKAYALEKLSVLGSPDCSTDG